MKKFSGLGIASFSLQAILFSTFWLVPGLAQPLQKPPGKLTTYIQIFTFVRTVTGYPFSQFPALGGADKAKFITDDLMNQDELIHTTTYLQGQLAIRKIFSPDTAGELAVVVKACEFLGLHFNHIATERDAQNNLSIGEADLERLFAEAYPNRKTNHQEKLQCATFLF